MARVTVLRDEARDAVFGAGGHGFVRFLAQGDALLVSDAVRRCDAGMLIDALKGAGFDAEVREGLLLITPGEARLMSFCAAQPTEMTIDWESPLFEAQALCERLLFETPLALDEGGRQLIVETARLVWQPQEKAMAGLSALRARIAVRLREGKRSGLHEAGRLLCGWLSGKKDGGGNGDEA